MDGQIFTSDSYLYCKICLSQPKEQFHKRGPESSGTTCINRLRTTTGKEDICKYR